MPNNHMVPETHGSLIIGRGISGSVLKLIAVVAMVVDHTAMVLLASNVQANTTLFSVLGYDISLYQIMRNFIGRIAFPIFCFLLVEGYTHTKDKGKYLKTLVLFAILSELPWRLAHGDILYPSTNVYFTLVLGFCGIALIDTGRSSDRLLLLVKMGVLLYVALAFSPDYSYRGVLFIIAMYVMADYPWFKILSCALILPNGPIAALAFIPISLYNGKRGFIQGKAGKYIFYAIYPVHFMILWVLSLVFPV